jgi:hypothetical protein
MHSQNGKALCTSGSLMPCLILDLSLSLETAHLLLKACFEILLSFSLVWPWKRIGWRKAWPRVPRVVVRRRGAVRWSAMARRHQLFQVKLQTTRLVPGQRFAVDFRLTSGLELCKFLKGLRRNDIGPNSGRRNSSHTYKPTPT